MKNILIAVQGHIQLIAGHIAYEWMKRKSTDDKSFITLLVYDLMIPEDDNSSMVDSIKYIANSFGYERIVILPQEEMDSISRQPYSIQEASLRNFVGLNCVDELYIGRDFLGFGSPLIARSYSESKKYLYGDSLGVFEEERNFRPNISSIFRKGGIRNIALHTISTFANIYQRTSLIKKADAAILILPIDNTKSYLREIRLIVPGKDFVCNIFNSISFQSDGYKALCTKVPDATKDNYLVLLSNLCSAGLMSYQSELNLYKDIIFRSIPKSSTIYLKRHPRGSIKMVSTLASLLVDYQVIIAHGKLEIFPIELWKLHLDRSKVLPIFSTSALNLKYIYDIDPVLTLTTEDIRFYAYPDKINYLLTGNDMIISGLNNIPNWTRDTPLWSQY